MKNPARTITRTGVVRAAARGCVTIEVGVPCGGCRQAACIARQRPRQLALSTSDLGPGDEVRLSVGLTSLTRVCLGLFGPPLIMLVFAGWLAASAPDAGAPVPAAVLAGIAGLVTALVLGARLARRFSRDLVIDVNPMSPVTGRISEV